jgi:hypothetical protein
MRNAHEILVFKPKKIRPFRRRRCTWEDNIKMGLQKIGWEGVDRILAEDRDR